MKHATVLILAGGRGTRMQATIPKPLHLVAGKSLLDRVLEAAYPICQKPYLVVGPGGETIVEQTKGVCEHVWQQQPLGTGHAVRCALEAVEREHPEHIVVVPADHPFVNTTIMHRLCEARERTGAHMAFATVTVNHFQGLYRAFYTSGRVMRNASGRVVKIIEARDAVRDERHLKEVNVSYYCFEPAWLHARIDALDTDNDAEELYLTDLVSFAAREPNGVAAVKLDEPFEGFGVNTQGDLQAAEYISKTGIFEKQEYTPDAS